MASFGCESAGRALHPATPFPISQASMIRTLLVMRAAVLTIPKHYRFQTKQVWIEVAGHEDPAARIFRQAKECVMKFTTDMIKTGTLILLTIVITSLANYSLVPLLLSPWQWAKKTPLAVEYLYTHYSKQGIVKIINRDQSLRTYKDIEVHVSFDKPVRIDSVDCWDTCSLAFSRVDYTSSSGEELHFKLPGELVNRRLVYSRLHFHGIIDAETVSYPGVMVEGDGIHSSFLEANIYAGRLMARMRGYLILNSVILVLLVGSAVSYFRLKATITSHKEA